jgi:hypothetical protein
MPRGVPLTPDQAEAIARVYAETGNAAAAARAAGVNKSTVTRLLERTGQQRRATLHARACARAIRRARKHLSAAGDLLARVLTTEGDGMVGLEPKDLAALVNAQARATEALLAIDERRDRSAQARLTRAKTRGEIAYLTARLAGALPPDRVQVESLTDAELDARVRDLAARTGLVPGAAGGPGGAGGAPGGTGPAPGAGG